MLIAPSTPAEQAAPSKKRGYRSEAETSIREAVDRWGRDRWPEARVVHELVVFRGSVRCDMAFVSPRQFVTVEIKSGWDGTERLVNQVAMFRLASPETWMVCEPKHRKDVDLVHYLLPHVGVAEAVRQMNYDAGPFRIEVIHEPKPFVAVPEAMLSVLWVQELVVEARRARVWQGSSKKPPSHRVLVDLMLKLSPEEQLAAVCRQLRARDALWRADPPVPLEPFANGYANG